MATKLFINVNIHLNSESMTVKRVISAQVIKNADGSFRQLEGHVYNLHAGKLVSTGAKWFWGKGKDGKLYREADGRGKVWMSLCGTYCAHEIAAAVEAAFKTGEGVISESFDEPAITPEVEEPLQLPVNQVEIEADVADDLVIVDGIGESPIDRLQAGDPTLFIELGFPQVYAERWASQIRSGDIAVNSVEDVVNIRGIGKVRAEQLISNWHAKFEK